MKSITCFNDLRPYGIDALTGEACGLSYRILFDVTEKGRQILGKAFGIPHLSLSASWNRGSKEDPHVGSIMLSQEMLVPIAIFALLENGCTEVWLVNNGSAIGVEKSDSQEIVEANRHLVGDRFIRSLGYRGTAGDRNVHQMSGRIE